MKFATWASAALLAATPLASEAVQMTALYTPLGGSNWQVDLTLSNDDAAFVSASNPSGSISEFTVFFPFADYSTLSSLAAPAVWDALVIQPDASPSDGYVDYLVTGPGVPLAAGQSLAGLSIGFTYSGGAAPDVLTYTVVNPNTFATLFQGQTVVVPEPATHALWLLGLGAVAWRVSRRNVRRTF